MGTWAIPQTKKQAVAILKILEENYYHNNEYIPLNELNGLVGDDNLFDMASNRKIHCFSVARWIQDQILAHDKDPNRFSKPWTEGNKAFLHKGLKPYLEESWQDRKTGKLQGISDAEKAHKRFIKGLEKLSKQTGIVIRVCGNIRYINPNTIQEIVYSEDLESGDINPQVWNKGGKV